MYEKSRNNKGSVAVESFQGRLRLRLPRELGLKNRYFTLGMADTPENWKIAEGKAKQIESDIVYERFDASLNKYRNKTVLAVVEAIKHKPAYSLVELWHKYTEYKRPALSVMTLKNTYQAVAYHLSKIPKDSETVETRNYFMAMNPSTAKKYLINISACYKWAMRNKLVSENPFADMPSEIKLPSKTAEDIQPFTTEERDAIINAFEKDKYYSHYASYVKFLFFTGCRTGEAIGLQWKHIPRDCSTIAFSESVVRGNRKATKTNESRTFPCNSRLKELLSSIKPQEYNPEMLVFPSPDGKPIDDHNFCNRAWRGSKNRHGNFQDGIVTRLVKEGEVSSYRSQYNTRHTFITLALENGLDVKDVARLAGNSPEIIYKHYAGTNLSKLQIPEF